MKTKSNTRNELFKRNEIELKIDAEKTPSFEEMKKKISEEFKKPEENVFVYNVKGKFGLKSFNISAYVYDSKEDLKKAEQKTQKQRASEKEGLKKSYEEAKKSKAAAAEEAKPENPETA